MANTYSAVLPPDEIYTGQAPEVAAPSPVAVVNAPVIPNSLRREAPVPAFQPQKIARPAPVYREERQPSVFDRPPPRGVGRVMPSTAPPSYTPRLSPSPTEIANQRTYDTEQRRLEADRIREANRTGKDLQRQQTAATKQSYGIAEDIYKAQNPGAKTEKITGGGVVPKPNLFTGKQDRSEFTDKVRSDDAGIPYQTRIDENGKVVVENPDKNAKISSGKDGDKGVYFENKEAPWTRIEPEQALFYPDKRVGDVYSKDELERKKAEIRQRKQEIREDKRIINLSPTLKEKDTKALREKRFDPQYSNATEGEIAQTEKLLELETEEARINAENERLAKLTPESFKRELLANVPEEERVKIKSQMVSDRLKYTDLQEKEIGGLQQSLEKERQELLAQRSMPMNDQDRVLHEYNVASFSTRTAAWQERKNQLDKELGEISASADEIKQVTKPAKIHEDDVIRLSKDPAGMAEESIAIENEAAALKADEEAFSQENKTKGGAVGSNSASIDYTLWFNQKSSDIQRRKEGLKQRAEAVDNARMRVQILAEDEQVANLNSKEFFKGVGNTIRNNNMEFRQKAKDLPPEQRKQLADETEKKNTEALEAAATKQQAISDLFDAWYHPKKVASDKAEATANAGGDAALMGLGIKSLDIAEAARQKTAKQGTPIEKEQEALRRKKAEEAVDIIPDAKLKEWAAMTGAPFESVKKVATDYHKAAFQGEYANVTTNVLSDGSYAVNPTSLWSMPKIGKQVEALAPEEAKKFMAAVNHEQNKPANQVEIMKAMKDSFSGTWVAYKNQKIKEELAKDPSQSMGSVIAKAITGFREQEHLDDNKWDAFLNRRWGSLRGGMEIFAKAVSSATTGVISSGIGLVGMMNPNLTLSDTYKDLRNITGKAYKGEQEKMAGQNTVGGEVTKMTFEMMPWMKLGALVGIGSRALGVGASALESKAAPTVARIMGMGEKAMIEKGASSAAEVAEVMAGLGMDAGMAARAGNAYMTAVKTGSTAPLMKLVVAGMESPIATRVAIFSSIAGMSAGAGFNAASDAYAEQALAEAMAGKDVKNMSPEQLDQYTKWAQEKGIHQGRRVGIIAGVIGGMVATAFPAGMSSITKKMMGLPAEAVNMTAADLAKAGGVTLTDLGKSILGGKMKESLITLAKLGVATGKGIVKDAIPEGIEEVIDNFTQSMVEKMSYNPNLTMGEIIKSSVEGGKFGVLMGILPGVVETMSKGRMIDQARKQMRGKESGTEGVDDTATAAPEDQLPDLEAFNEQFNPTMFAESMGGQPDALAEITGAIEEARAKLETATDADKPAAQQELVDALSAQRQLVEEHAGIHYDVNNLSPEAKAELDGDNSPEAIAVRAALNLQRVDGDVSLLNDGDKAILEGGTQEGGSILAEGKGRAVFTQTFIDGVAARFPETAGYLPKSEYAQKLVHWGESAAKPKATEAKPAPAPEAAPSQSSTQAEQAKQAAILRRSKILSEMTREEAISQQVYDILDMPTVEVPAINGLMQTHHNADHMLGGKYEMIFENRKSAEAFIESIQGTPGVKYGINDAGGRSIVGIQNTTNDGVSNVDAVLGSRRSPTVAPTTTTAPAIENGRDEDLFPDKTDFMGKLKQEAKLKSYSKKDGFGVAEYANTDTGITDVYIAAFGDNDFIAYIRVYDKDGKATNQFTSKLERRTEAKGVTKAMLSELQSRLPAEHEYTEDTSVSTDGLKFIAGQLNQGYEVVMENGKPKTQEVAISGESKANDLPIAVDPNGAFENISVKTKKEFDAVRPVIAGMLAKFGVGLGEANVRWENGTVFIDIPVLKKTAAEGKPIKGRSAEAAPAPKKTYDPDVEEAIKGIETDSQVPLTDKDKDDVETAVAAVRGALKRFSPAFKGKAPKFTMTGNQTAGMSVSDGNLNVHVADVLKSLKGLKDPKETKRWAQLLAREEALHQVFEDLRKDDEGRKVFAGIAEGLMNSPDMVRIMKEFYPEAKGDNAAHEFLAALVAGKIQEKGGKWFIEGKEIRQEEMFKDGSFLDRVTNALKELRAYLAKLIGMEGKPDGWDGMVKEFMGMVDAQIDALEASAAKAEKKADEAPKNEQTITEPTPTNEQPEPDKLAGNVAEPAAESPAPKAETTTPTETTTNGIETEEKDGQGQERNEQLLEPPAAGEQSPVAEPSVAATKERKAMAENKAPIPQKIIEALLRSGHELVPTGDSNSGFRQMLMQVLTGQKMPKAKSGVNAVEKALFAYLGVEKNHYAGMRDDAKAKLRAMLDVKESPTNGVVPQKDENVSDKPVELNGEKFSVYPYKDKFLVQQNDKRQIFGDQIFNTREEAEKQAATDKKIDESNKEYRAKQEAIKQDEAAALAAKQKPVNDYLDSLGLNPMQRGKAFSVLDKQAVKNTAKKTYVGSRFDVVKQMVDDGYNPMSEEVDAIQDPSRTQWNRMDNRQQAAFDKKKLAAGNKTEYRMGKGDGFFVVTKAEHDLAEYFRYKKEPKQAEPSEAAPISPKVEQTGTPALEATGELGGTSASPQVSTFSPDDNLIMHSPYTGDDTTVSYRGDYEGKAVIWTGKTQMSVPKEWLRRKGETRTGPTLEKETAKTEAPISEVSIPAETEAQEPPFPKGKKAMALELVGPKPTDYVRIKTWEKQLAAILTNTSAKLEEMVTDSRAFDKKHKALAAKTRKNFAPIESLIASSPEHWRKAFSSLAQANGIEGYVTMPDNSKGDETYRLAKHLAELGVDLSKQPVEPSEAPTPAANAEPEATARDASRPEQMTPRVDLILNSPLRDVSGAKARLEELRSKVSAEQPAYTELRVKADSLRKSRKKSDQRELGFIEEALKRIKEKTQPWTDEMNRLSTQISNAENIAIANDPSKTLSQRFEARTQTGNPITSEEINVLKDAVKSEAAAKIRSEFPDVTEKEVSSLVGRASEIDRGLFTWGALLRGLRQAEVSESSKGYSGFSSFKLGDDIRGDYDKLFSQSKDTPPPTREVTDKLSDAVSDWVENDKAENQKMLDEKRKADDEKVKEAQTVAAEILSRPVIPGSAGELEGGKKLSTAFIPQRAPIVPLDTPDFKPLKPKDAIKALYPITSDDANRYVLHGVFITEVKGRMVAVATDGRRLIVTPYAGDLKPDTIYSAGRVKPSQKNPKAIAEGGVIDGNFPNFQQVIPKKGNMAIPLTSEMFQLLRQLERANKIIEGKGYTASFRLASGDYITFDSSFLLSEIKALQQAGYPEITMRFKDAMSPVVLETSDPQALGVLMPMRIEGGAKEEPMHHLLLGDLRKPDAYSKPIKSQQVPDADVAGGKWEHPGIATRRDTIARLEAEEQAMWDSQTTTRVSGADFASGARMDAVAREERTRQSVMNSERYKEIQSAKESLYATIRKLKKEKPPADDIRRSQQVPTKADEPLSMANDPNNARREARGDAPLITKPVPNEVSQAMAAAALKADSQAGREMAKEIMAGRKNDMTAVDWYVLQTDARTIRNDLAAIELAIVDAKTEEAKQRLRARQDALKDDLYDNEVAAHASGTQPGRFLQARQDMIREDYSYVARKRKVSAALGRAFDKNNPEDVKLDAELEAQGEAYKQALDELIAARQEIEAKEATIQEQAAHIKALEDAEKARVEGANPETNSIFSKFIAKVMKSKDSLMDKVKALGAAFLKSKGDGSQKSQWGGGMDDSIVGLAAVYRAEGANSMAEIRDMFVRDMGEEMADAVLEGHMETIWEATDKHLDELMDKELAGKSPSTKKAVKARVKKTDDPSVQITHLKERMKSRVEDGNGISNLNHYVQKVAVNLIRQGMTDRAEMMAALHSHMEDIIPGVTMREVSDAFSNYGVFKELPDDSALETKRIMQDLERKGAKISDMEQGKWPLNTGVERQTPTAEMREMTTQVNELAKKFAEEHPELVPESSAASKASIQQTIAKRLRNEIEEIQRAIDTKIPRVNSKGVVVYDADNIILRDELKQKRKEYAEHFPKEGKKLTEAEKQALYEKNLAARIERMETMLAEGKIWPDNRLPWSPNIDETAEGYIATMKADLNALRAADTAHNEQKRIDKLREIQEYNQKRIATMTKSRVSDFKEKTPRPMSADESKLRTANKLLRKEILNLQLSLEPKLRESKFRTAIRSLTERNARAEAKAAEIKAILERIMEAKKNGTPIPFSDMMREADMRRQLVEKEKVAKAEKRAMTKEQIDDDARIRELQRKVTENELAFDYLEAEYADMQEGKLQKTTKIFNRIWRWNVLSGLGSLMHLSGAGVAGLTAKLLREASTFITKIAGTPFGLHHIYNLTTHAGRNSPRALGALFRGDVEAAGKGTEGGLLRFNTLISTLNKLSLRKPNMDKDYGGGTKARVRDTGHIDMTGKWSKLTSMSKTEIVNLLADTAGGVHGALKEPFRNAYFAEAAVKEWEAAVRMGHDPIKSEAIRMGIRTRALFRANGEIMMGDNVMSRVMIRAMKKAAMKEEYNPATGKFIANTIDFLFPVKTVPLNIMARQLSYISGIPVGLWMIATHKIRGKLKGIKDGTQTLTLQEAEFIAEQIRNGGVGLMALLTVWANAARFGGTYIPGQNLERKKKLKYGALDLSGTIAEHFAKLLGVADKKGIVDGHWLHDPLFGMMNQVVQMQRTYEHEFGLNDDGFMAGIRSAAVGVNAITGQIPLINAIARATSAYQQPGEILLDAAASVFTPGIAKGIAQWQDKDEYNESIVREPDTFVDRIKAGWPGYRKEVPALQTGENLVGMAGGFVPEADGSTPAWVGKVIEFNRKRAEMVEAGTLPPGDKWRRFITQEVSPTLDSTGTRDEVRLSKDDQAFRDKTYKENFNRLAKARNLKGEVGPAMISGLRSDSSEAQKIATKATKQRLGIKD